MAKNTDTQMDGASLDIAEQRKHELKQLFPGVFTETKNDKGELVESIDFERLKAELGAFSDIYDNRRERYGMDWPGKRDCLRLIQEPSYATLKPCREESIDFDTTKNLFIEGDNLEVLKLLQKAYYGKIKMIYIDPPYNTGKEFIYPDNYSESLETYLAYAGLSDAEGKKFSTNTQAEGRFHTKWLNMMYPRLYLARNLLKEDGVIFISIDDNEVENLRRMCDEIFGEENFVGTIIWQKVFSPKNSAKFLSEDHDYIIVYARNTEKWRPTLLERSEESIARYQNLDDDLRGPWASSDLCARNYYSEGIYSVTCPSGRVIDGPPQGSYWRISKQNFLKYDAENRIWWGEDGNNMPRQKRFLSEVKEGVVPQTLLLHSLVGHTQEAKKELIEFVDFENTENVLNSVKPTRLIRHLLKIGTNPKENDIVLDFFTGSGTTGHAVMAQNAEDGGNRQFILIQLPEPLKTEERDVKDIADLARSRITNFGNKLKRDIDQSISDMFEKKALPDCGVKVIALNKSNFKQWQEPDKDVRDSDLIQQIELAVDHINPNASQEDLLYELLLKSGITPTENVTVIELAGHNIFSVGDGGLLVNLEDTIDKGLIDAMLEQKPEQFICLDKAFHGNDQLKANAVKTFEAYNQSVKGEDLPITFRTV